jgi:hypothetical protein
MLYFGSLFCLWLYLGLRLYAIYILLFWKKGGGKCGAHALLGIELRLVEKWLHPKSPMC